MNIRVQCRILAILPFLGLGCGGDDDTVSPGITAAGGGATTAGNGTAGAVAVGGQAGTAGATAPPGIAGAAAGTAGTAGTAAAAAGTGTAGMDAPVAGAPAAGTGAAGTGAAGMAGMPSGSDGKLPHVAMVEGMGNEDAVLGTFGPAVKVKDTPPGGWLVYPMDIGRDGIKHPIFIFGPGGGTDPPYYDMNGMHWDHYASYGFVIYIAPMSSFSSAAALDDGLTWVIAQNDVATSPLYQKLDTTKVGAAGHSQGSVMVFNFMPDERVTTTIHISGGSMGGSGGPANLTGPTFFLCGPSSDVAYANCETDFGITKVPTVYSNILSASHLTSGRYGWGAIVAWLLWHLAGHEEWKKEFLEPGGKFQTGRYTTKTKNW
ncbi:MAG TPA: hypothetical protein VK524_21875 [Polyangiaceae bacterium]|nr:hypothetical protein [Polyangiaceae bacterium]